MVLIERPQAVNMKYLEGKKNPASEIGQTGQTTFNSIESTSCGRGKMEGACEGISSFGAQCKTDFYSYL